jgi:hypothetical protein
MYMSPTLRDEYGWLADHLKDDIPKFLDSGLVPALMKYGDFGDLKNLGICFAWDTAPIVNVRHLSKDWGRLVLGTSELELTDYMVRDFEIFYPRWLKAKDDPTHRGLAGFQEEALKKSVIRLVPGGWAWLLDVVLLSLLAAYGENMYGKYNGLDRILSFEKQAFGDILTKKLDIYIDMENPDSDNK